MVVLALWRANPISPQPELSRNSGNGGFRFPLGCSCLLAGLDSYLRSLYHSVRLFLTGNVPHRRDPFTHYSLSRYSPGTSSCGTSCVRTSISSASPASSTPFTTSASNAFPSSSNSSTLSESAPSTLDNPCKSPDCSPECGPSPSSPNATVSTLWLFSLTCFLRSTAVFRLVVFLPRAFVFTSAFFGAAFFSANFFLGVTLILVGFF